MGSATPRLVMPLPYFGLMQAKLPVPQDLSFAALLMAAALLGPMIELFVLTFLDRII